VFARLVPTALAAFTRAIAADPAVSALAADGTFPSVVRLRSDPLSEQSFTFEPSSAFAATLDPLIAFAATFGLVTALSPSLALVTA